MFDDDVSDFYFCVYLFEFKDAIIPVKVKNSSSFNEIKAGVFEKFVYNEKDDRKKGISQLSYAIENYPRPFHSLQGFRFLQILLLMGTLHFVSFGFTLLTIS